MYRQRDESESSDSTGLSESSDSTDSIDSTIENSRARFDGHKAATDIWRQYEKHTFSPPAAAIANSQTAVANPMQAGATDKLGIWNTEFRYAERRQTGVLMVDSLDRDWAAFPLPTSLRLHLPRTYRNVDRLDIVQIKFFNGIWPFSAQRKNTTLCITDVSGVSHCATIPDGNYTIPSMINAINAALTPLGLGITVSYNVAQGRFLFSSQTNPFTLAWPVGLSSQKLSAGSSWGLGWNLGFGGPAADVPAILINGVWSAIASCCPRMCDDYFFLQLNFPEHMNMVDHTSPENYDISQESTGQVAHYFGKLLLNGFGCWAQTFIEMPKIFRPVLGRLDFLTFTWLDRSGSPLAGPDAASCDWNMAVRTVEIAEGSSQTSALTMAGQTPAMATRGLGGHPVPLEHGTYTGHC